LSDPNAPQDDNARLVDAFRKIADAFLTMGKIRENEAHTWGIYLSRHADRASRNAHRVLSARFVMEATRSEQAWGSHEAAAVARGNPTTPGGMLDKILETALPTKAPPAPNESSQEESQGAAS
jgi:hypothetical protein